MQKKLGKDEILSVHPFGDTKIVRIYSSKDVLDEAMVRAAVGGSEFTLKSFRKIEKKGPEGSAKI